MPGWRVIAWPTVAPRPWTRAMRFGGTPASSSTSTSRWPISGVISDGLKIDAVAGGERRRDLPGRHREGKVPRRYHRDDADRLAEREDDLARFAGVALAVETKRLAGIEPEIGGDPPRLVARLGEGLALLAGEFGRDLVGPPRHDLGGLEQDVRPDLGRSGGPSRPRRGHRGDRRVDILGPGIGEASDQVALIGRDCDPRRLRRLPQESRCRRRGCGGSRSWSFRNAGARSRARGRQELAAADLGGRLVGRLDGRVDGSFGGRGRRRAEASPHRAFPGTFQDTETSPVTKVWQAIR